MDYRGVAAVVVAVALGATLVIGIGGVAWSGRPFSDAGGEALVAIGGALVGALAGYLAGRQSNGSGKPPSEKPET